MRVKANDQPKYNETKKTISKKSVPMYLKYKLDPQNKMAHKIEKDTLALVSESNNFFVF